MIFLILFCLALLKVYSNMALAIMRGGHCLAHGLLIHSVNAIIWDRQVGIIVDIGQHCSVLCCFVLVYTVLYCTDMYCIAP